jgi:hypothetical protein
MLPYSENTDDLVSDSEEEQPENTKTFGLNLTTNTVGGMIDELEALKQSIYLKLSIEGDQFIILPYTYGLVTIDLIGMPVYYVMAVIPDRITETLMDDDRITDVSDFEFETKGSKLLVKFIVHTIYGENIDAETEVTF